MTIELNSELHRRAALHGALADPARLRIVDTLLVGDASPSELAGLLEIPSNLLAHHVKVLESAGLVVRARSEGDRRRSYLRLVGSALDDLRPPAVPKAPRVLFVCTANSARSHLAAALWRQACDIPAASAGTHPAQDIAPGAIATAARHRLDLPRVRPRQVADILTDEDLVVTVCDRAHEELHLKSAIHWSVPDPVQDGSPEAFDRAFEELRRRIQSLAPALEASFSPS
jgi:ArsR family transcriptional regulator, arsenate/arsenite/antimonite-responsive transcriptional repressor / arsenate reductase (thioredoxin)